VTAALLTVTGGGTEPELATAAMAALPTVVAKPEPATATEKATMER
jgi:hypothetical protein